MKKIFFSHLRACSAFALHVTIARPDTTATADTTDNSKAEGQKNIAASDAVMNAFQTGDASGLDSVIADDFVDHTDRGDKKGRDSLKAMVKFVHTNFRI